MKILDIYSRYDIPRNIQEHQIKVASVASMILENTSEHTFDEDLIITTCLLHDMGNIIKSDFSVFPEFLEPEGKDYWQSVKNKFISKYGDKEDDATREIIKEIGVKKKVVEIMKNFKYLDQPKERINGYVNICIYSDLRVGPYGVITALERIDDGEKRYSHRGNGSYSKEYFERLRKIWPKREMEILKGTKIKPEDINEGSVQRMNKSLKDYNIKVAEE